MSLGFFDRQRKMLASPLDETKIRERDQGGRTLHYIEGWFAMAEANAIFGYDGWDRQTVMLDRVYERTRDGVTACAYAARVRITVRARAQLVVREGTGFGHASAALAGDAHERAIKAAETDATKRALSTFGSRFGLLLYDKEYRSTINRAGIGGPGDRAAAGCDREQAAQHAELAAVRQIGAEGDQSAGGSDHPAGGAAMDGFGLVTAEGEVWPVASPESYCSGLRQFFEGARSLEELHRLRKANQRGLTRLRDMAGLTTPRGQHFADILERLLVKRAKELRITDPAKPLSGTEGSVAGKTQAHAAGTNETTITQPDAIRSGARTGARNDTAACSDADVVGIETAKTNSGTRDHPHHSPHPAGTESPETGHDQSPEGPTTTTNTVDGAIEAPPEGGMGGAICRGVDDAETFGDGHGLYGQDGLCGQEGLPAGAYQAAVAAGPPISGQSNPDPAVPPNSPPQIPTTCSPGAAPASAGQTATTNSISPSERSSVIPSQGLAAFVGPVKPYIPVPPYPLRAVTAQLLNGHHTDDRQGTAQQDDGIGDVPSAEPLQATTAQDRTLVAQTADRDSDRLTVAEIEKNLAHAVTAVVPPVPTRRSQISGGYSIDKSVLAIPSERRLRSKAHLVMVAAQPCVVCEEMPCHAHHVTYAQPRGLSLKVSDEFTVPLCVKHHNEVHAKGNEKAWWRSQGIDPLDQARRLWLQSAGIPATGEPVPTPSTVAHGEGV